MPNTASLESLRLRLRAVEAQTREVQLLDRDPLEERLRAVVNEMLECGETEPLLAEFERLEAQTRQVRDSKATRLARLVALSIDLNQQIQAVEEARRNVESHKPRVATVEAARAVLPLATAWQKAAEAFVTATAKLYEGQAGVHANVVSAACIQHPGGDQVAIDGRVAMLAIVKDAARGRTTQHAAAIAEVFRRVAAEFNDIDRLREYVEFNEWASTTKDASMVTAATSAALDLEAKLGVAAS